VAIDADELAAAMADAMELMSRTVDFGWVRRRGGVVAAVSGFPVAELNGAFTLTRDPDPAALAELLDEVEAARLPYSVQLRPGVDESGLAARFLLRRDAVPLMALGAGGARRAAGPAGLRIRRLEPGEAVLHVRAMARGFEMPEEPWSLLITPALLAVPGARFYLGEVDGAAVATAAGLSVGGCLEIFNVATAPEHRSRGYGTAVTARVLADGFARGDRVAFLQSSPEGRGVYAAMGFSVVEHWAVWASPPEAAVPP
jgi:GNAT superfamily N-acetyltransferase